MTEHTTEADNAMPTVPREIGRDQEAAGGITRALIAADIDTTTEPRRIAIDLADNSGVRPDSSELGWFDVRTMIHNLAEFAPDLVVVRREDLPEVTITEHIDAPATCVVDIGGVRRFDGADWSHHAADAMHLRTQLTDARMKLATAENEARDLRTRWATYATALARLENNTTPQVIGTNIVMRHETYVEIEREIESLRDTWVTASTYDRERKDHDATRAELRTMTTIARKWQRFAAVLELMGDGTDVELTIDGVRIQIAKP